MPKGYREYFPDQDFLLPPSLGQWLPEGHLAYFVSDVVDQLDLTPMHAEYGEEKRGQPPYDPRMMTKHHGVAKVAIAYKLAVRLYWMLRSGQD